MSEKYGFRYSPEKISKLPHVARLQPFWDGNKRTAVMLSAVDLVNNG